MGCDMYLERQWQAQEDVVRLQAELNKCRKLLRDFVDDLEKRDHMSGHETALVERARRIAYAF